MIAGYRPCTEPWTGDSGGSPYAVSHGIRTSNTIYMRKGNRIESKGTGKCGGNGSVGNEGNTDSFLRAIASRGILVLFVSVIVLIIIVLSFRINE